MAGRASPETWIALLTLAALEAHATHFRVFCPPAAMMLS